MGKTIAIYPGSFDPVTRGHMDIIERASKTVDHLIVGVLVNSAKSPLFTVEERVALLKQVTAQYPNVEIRSFEGLLVDFARASGAHILIRGLRAVSDYEYELGYAFANHDLSYGEVETVFIPAAREYMYLSSSSVREAAMVGARLDIFVDDKIAEIVKEKVKTIKG